MPDRLLYATPTGKHPHPGYVSSLRTIELTCQSFERRPEDFLMACGPVQMARSEIAERAIAGACTTKHDHMTDGGKACAPVPYDYLLMHDDDLIVNPEGALGNPLDVWHEVFAKHPEVGVIGAVYLREKMGTPTVVLSHPEFPEENCHAVFGLPYGLLDVSGIGTGFMMVRASVLAALKEREDGAHSLFRFPFNRTRWGTVNQTGEDYDFCARVRAAGYRVLVDSRFETAHIKESGTLTYHHETYERSWSDATPDMDEATAKAHVAAQKQRAAALQSALQPGIKALVVNGVMCLDHVPLLVAEGNQRAEKRAAAAPAKKEAA